MSTRRGEDRSHLRRAARPWWVAALGLTLTGAVALAVPAAAPATTISSTRVAPPVTAATVAATTTVRTTTTSPVWVAREVRAAGVTQWIACAGRGPMTIVVIAGLHADHRMWAPVLAAFARTTRTCIYDRPNLGSSPTLPKPRVVNAGQHADELWALLVAAQVPGPYLMVGHSYGGLIARTFVARHFTRVGGLMLIEGVAPNDTVDHYWAEAQDTVDVWASERAAAALQFGAKRLVVEAAQDADRNYWGRLPTYGETAAELAEWRAHQRAAASLSPQSTFVIVSRSAHVIEHDRPDAVIAGVRLIYASYVGRVRLPRCALSAYGSQPLC